MIWYLSASNKINGDPPVHNLIMITTSLDWYINLNNFSWHGQIELPGYINSLFRSSQWVWIWVPPRQFPEQTHSNHSGWSQKPVGWARARTHLGEAAFWKCIIGVETDWIEMIELLMTFLYHTPHFELTTNDFNNGSLTEVQFVVNMKQWKTSVCRQVTNWVTDIRETVDA
jgi:hypothetical protein